MKTASCLIVLLAILAPGSFAKTHSNSGAQQPSEIQISAKAAETLLIHKADLQCPWVAMPPRITCTVVVAFVLDRDGNVRHPTVVSGPALLRKPVLDAVSRYKYKPYLLNGRAVDAETTVLVAVDTARDCPNW
jgi:outer membrane biosynthesis protein TonB